MSAAFARFTLPHRWKTCIAPTGRRMCAISSAAWGRPLSSEYGTFQTVKAKFWPGVQVNVIHIFRGVSSSLGACIAPTGCRARKGVDIECMLASSFVDVDVR